MKTKVLTPCLGLLAAFALAFIFTACPEPNNNGGGGGGGGGGGDGDPALTGTVTILEASNGDIKIGSTLQALVSDSNAGDANEVSFNYQWQKRTGEDGEFTNIGTDSKEYPIEEDGEDDVAVGDYIKVVVTAEGFSGSIEGTAVEVLDDLPSITGDVTFARQPAGTIRIGNTVKATVTGLNADAVPVYQWQKADNQLTATFTNIGTDSDTYVISATDVAENEYIRVTVSAEGFSGRILSSRIIVQAAATGPLYTVTFEAGDGATLAPGTPATWEVESGEYIYLYNNYTGWYYKAVKPGYVFMGWYDKSDQSKTVIEERLQVTGNITLVPTTWEQGVAVTLVLDGGTYLDWNNNPVPTIHAVLPGSTFSLYYNEPTKDEDGIIFYGWYTTINGTETKIDLMNGIRVDADITLVAKWGPPVKVELKLDGGTLLQYGTPLDLEYEYAPGYLFKLYDKPEKAGVLFACWYKEGDSNQTPVDLDTGITLTESIILVAKYGTAVTVTLHANGGEFGSGTTEFTVGSGGLFDPFDRYMIRPIRTGYICAGWKIGEDGAPVSGVITVTTDITLYALWLDEAVLGAYANAEGSYLLTTDYNSSRTGAYFSNTTIKPISWSYASVDGQAATITATAITVGGTNYPRVATKKTPQYSASLSGTWEKDGVQLYLGGGYQTDGSATLSGTGFYIDICYATDASNLYLLQNIYVSYGVYADGEVIMTIPLSGNNLTGWTKQY
jgi:uncharacterized repeat protein (TIGR02543 family)